MLFCTKAKNNVDMYFYKGKHVSHKKATSLSKRRKTALPECVSKYPKFTPVVQQILAKADNFEVQHNVIKQKYDDLYNKLNEASEEIEVMNKICMSKEFKEKMDETYKKAKQELDEKIKQDVQQITLLKNENKRLNDIVTQNQININNLNDLLERSREESNVCKQLQLEENVVKQDLTNKLNNLIDECKDRPDLLFRIKELNAALSEKNTIELEKSEVMRNQLVDYESEVKDSINKLQESENKYNQAIETIKANELLMLNLRENIAKLQSDNESLQKENIELNNNVKSGDETFEKYKALRNQLKETKESEEKLLEQMKQEHNKLKEKENELIGLKKSIQGYVNRLSNIENECINLPSISDKLKELKYYTDQSELYKLDIAEKDESLNVASEEVRKLNDRVMKSETCCEQLKDKCADNPELLYKVEELKDLLTNANDMVKLRDNALTNLKMQLKQQEEEIINKDNMLQKNEQLITQLEEQKEKEIISKEKQDQRKKEKEQKEKSLKLAQEEKAKKAKEQKDKLAKQEQALQEELKKKILKNEKKKLEEKERLKALERGWGKTKAK
jgi:chromosome segregation ATPase